MQRRKSVRLGVDLLACLALLASAPAAAQDGWASDGSPAPVCRAGVAEFQPRVELTAPPLAAELRERGRNVVVLNGRGYNYTSGVQAPTAPARRALPPPRDAR